MWRARASRVRPRSNRTLSSREARPHSSPPADSIAIWRKSPTADWIIEAIVEQIDAKKTLLDRVDAVRRSGSIVSSNTSGIPIASLAEGRSDDFRRHWLGTHFFNPPRYLRLLEVIPTAETDPRVVEVVSAFADHRLGKGVVIAKDTPNFIANHIGLFGVMQMIRALEAGEYTIEEIDAITGPALGRPKSATFRTMDIAGIDVLGHVARNLVEHLQDEEARQAFALPPLVQALIERGWVGEKAGQGFYKRTREGEILTLDPASLTYRPRQEPRLPVPRRGAIDRRPEGAREGPVFRRRQSGRFFARDPRSDAPLHGPRRSNHRDLHR